jgi:hypothetical protein
VVEPDYLGLHASAVGHAYLAETADADGRTFGLDCHTRDADDGPAADEQVGLYKPRLVFSEV